MHHLRGAPVPQDPLDLVGASSDERLGVGGVEGGEALGDGGAVGGADEDGVAALEAALDGGDPGGEKSRAALEGW
jgi:hypothetical protein